jgi:hypothetical protein
MTNLIDYSPLNPACPRDGSPLDWKSLVLENLQDLRNGSDTVVNLIKLKFEF